MGDDELNFTEEEARDWEKDPRNQVQDWTACEQALAFSAVLVIAALLLIWLASIPVQQPADPGQVPAAGEAGPAHVPPKTAAAPPLSAAAISTLPSARVPAYLAHAVEKPRVFETLNRPRSSHGAAPRTILERRIQPC